MPTPKAWSTHPLLSVERERDHIDRLYLINQLAGAGVAASDSMNNVAHIAEKLEGLFVVISRLAGEAIDMAEHERARVKK